MTLAECMEDMLKKGIGDRQFLHHSKSISWLFRELI
jgi:hypothetical protein